MLGEAAVGASADGAAEGVCGDRDAGAMGIVAAALAEATDPAGAAVPQATTTAVVANAKIAPTRLRRGRWFPDTTYANLH